MTAIFARTLGVLSVVLGLGCSPGGDPSPAPGLGGLGDTGDADTGHGSHEGSADGSTDGSDDADSTAGDDAGEPACGAAGQPACDCTATDETGERLLGPCHPGCQETYWRWSMWTTGYNVSGTLGYGEHQGNGIIGYAYRYDPRFGPADGVERPWRTPQGQPWAVGDGSGEAEQFTMRTQNPGGEIYVEPVVMPGDEDGLWSGETLPLVPSSVEHAAIEAAALCEEPQRLVDVRHYNHGRTLAQTVPNHAWDSFFTTRGLIPMALLEVIELHRSADGAYDSPTLVLHDGVEQDVDACLHTIDDGFCDARCGNCSYVMPTGFIGTAFGATAPGHQITGIPAGSNAPFQVGDGGLVAARSNWSALEDGHTVWYVGGSVWGRAQEVASYGFDDWPDPDGVPALAPGEAWMSVAGADLVGGDGIPDEWTDPFTHCVDPSDGWGSQRPAGWPRFISGRWGHNSNSDAEASLRQFLGCAQDPAQAATDDWMQANACDACGVPHQDPSGQPTQHPCRDFTHTATSYWERSPGTHDVDDLDPGKLDAVGLPRAPTDSWADLPKPQCRDGGQPVYGM
ncbi:hypothetical protein [Paraliomyxa miuraensis]|uniref:hypothetical protein n=1 Tax=Paraliomyxa miuraensis TaxID=376150 RepID=UPI00224EEA8E|nr:hypothetical protein [Paraliomyxa miuraensis]MCX4242498.1 hypothetical protein [Paraliomyxa miuraensis]